MTRLPTSVRATTLVWSYVTVGELADRTSITVPGVELWMVTWVGVVSFASSSINPTPVFRVGNCCL